MAEIDDIESTRRSKVGIKENKHVPKFKLIKTHTAGRSFCTNTDTNDATKNNISE
jgi:hypothetical protein